MAFALTGAAPILELPRDAGLELLEWLGLGRPEFGAIEVRVLLPLCRRRLWPERRNCVPSQRFVAQLVQAIARSSDGLVQFG